MLKTGRAGLNFFQNGNVQAGSKQWAHADL